MPTTHARAKFSTSFDASRYAPHIKGCFMKSVLQSVLFASAFLSASCGSDDLIARYTRESDLQQRANCVCPSNGTTETCLEEVDLRYPSDEIQDCQRRVVAMYPNMRGAVACLADTLEALRTCFDEAYMDCATADEATCGAQFNERTLACPEPEPEASAAIQRCMR